MYQLHNAVCLCRMLAKNATALVLIVFAVCISPAHSESFSSGIEAGNKPLNLPITSEADIQYTTLVEWCSEIISPDTSVWCGNVKLMREFDQRTRLPEHSAALVFDETAQSHPELIPLVHFSRSGKTLVTDIETPESERQELAKRVAKAGNHTDGHPQIPLDELKLPVKESRSIPFVELQRLCEGYLDSLKQNFCGDQNFMENFGHKTPLVEGAIMLLPYAKAMQRSDVSVMVLFDQRYALVAEKSVPLEKQKQIAQRILSLPLSKTDFWERLFATVGVVFCVGLMIWGLKFVFDHEQYVTSSSYRDSSQRTRRPPMPTVSPPPLNLDTGLSSRAEDTPTLRNNSTAIPPAVSPPPPSPPPVVSGKRKVIL